jgi:hypothetical protein
MLKTLDASKKKRIATDKFYCSSVFSRVYITMGVWWPRR